MDTEADVSLNVLLLQLTCQKCITQITRSAQNCPTYPPPCLQSVIFIREIREICRFLKSTISERFSGHENIAIGSFLFLRFFNTAVAVPESYGLLSCTVFSAPFLTLISSSTRKNEKRTYSCLQNITSASQPTTS